MIVVILEDAAADIESGRQFYETRKQRLFRVHLVVDVDAARTLWIRRELRKRS